MERERQLNWDILYISILWYLSGWFLPQPFLLDRRRHSLRKIHIAPAMLWLQKQNCKSDLKLKVSFPRMSFVSACNTQHSKYHVCFRCIEHDTFTSLSYGIQLCNRINFEYVAVKSCRGGNLRSLWQAQSLPFSPFIKLLYMFFTHVTWSWTAYPFSGMAVEWLLRECVQVWEGKIPLFAQVGILLP